MSELGPKSDYLPVFEVDGFNLLLSDLIMQSYGRYGQIELCERGHLREFSNRSMWAEATSEGLDLYGSSDNFSSYAKLLDRLFSENTERMTAVTSSNSPDALSFFELAKELLDAYVKLSPMFTDEAYAQSTHNKVLAGNLARAEKAKERHRQDVSHLFLEANSPMAALMAHISTQRKVDARHLWWLTVDELTKQDPRQIVESQRLDDRRRAFVQVGGSGGISNYYGGEAHERIKRFDGQGSIGPKSTFGTVASRGKSNITRGRVIVINLDYSDMQGTWRKMEEMREGDVLISQTTSPELMVACRKAAAIVTDVGGLLSHAAIVSRELGIPCIVGTGNASRLFGEGDIIEVNTDTGNIIAVSSQT